MKIHAFIPLLFLLAHLQFHMDEIHAEESRTKQKIHRCRGAIDKISHMRSSLALHKSNFEAQRLERVRETENVFGSHHNGLREHLAALRWPQYMLLCGWHKRSRSDYL